MCNRARLQVLKSGDEYDFVCARNEYCYLKNGKSVRHSIKKRLNKRYRKELREDMMKELQIA